MEQQGYVWVYTDRESTPNLNPTAFLKWTTNNSPTFAMEGIAVDTLYATAENILDVPHTAFLHKGLFRGVETQRVKRNTSLSTLF